jgi:PqqD family protein of HPr-rel-A system
MNQLFHSEMTLTKGGFLFDHSTGLTYTINPTGREIFEQLQAGVDAPEIIRELSTNYEVDEDTAREDLEDFLRQMKELGLVA